MNIREKRQPVRSLIDVGTIDDSGQCYTSYSKWPIGKSLRWQCLTMEVVDDLIEASLLSNLNDNLLNRVCPRVSSHKRHETDGSSLKITPIRVKIISWLIIKKLKYLATTARSSLERVKAPIYWEEYNQRVERWKKRWDEPWSTNAWW